ncbi:hypothetical protein ACLOJK_014568, partial [Asimina triloba]
VHELGCTAGAPVWCSITMFFMEQWAEFQWVNSRQLRRTWLAKLEQSIRPITASSRWQPTPIEQGKQRPVSMAAPKPASLMTDPASRQQHKSSELWTLGWPDPARWQKSATTNRPQIGFSSDPVALSQADHDPASIGQHQIVADPTHDRSWQPTQIASIDPWLPDLQQQGSMTSKASSSEQNFHCARHRLRVTKQTECHT